MLTREPLRAMPPAARAAVLDKLDALSREMAAGRA
jgi:hypothetical protein